MFGIFVLPANPSDKEYPYKKDPKKPLKFSDEELAHFVKITPKMAYFCHYKDIYDASSPEEKIKIIERFTDRDYSSLKKVRGIENAYQTEDGEYYIRIVVQEYEWFKRHLN